MGSQGCGTDPTDHHGTEGEGRGFHTHLQGNRIAHVKKLRHAPAGRSAAEGCIRELAEAAAAEHIDGKTCKHDYPGDKGTDAGPLKTKFRKTEFSINQDPVSKYVQKIASEQEKHRHDRSADSVGKLLQGVESHHEQSRDSDQDIVWPNQREQFRALPEPVKKGIDPEDARSSKEAYYSVEFQTIAKRQTSSIEISPTEMGAHERRHPGGESELNQDEEIHHVVYE